MYVKSLLTLTLTLLLSCTITPEPGSPYIQKQGFSCLTTEAINQLQDMYLETREDGCYRSEAECQARKAAFLDKYNRIYGGEGWRFMARCNTEYWVMCFSAPGYRMVTAPGEYCYTDWYACEIERTFNDSPCYERGGW